MSLGAAGVLEEVLNSPFQIPDAFAKANRSATQQKYAEQLPASSRNPTSPHDGLRTWNCHKPGCGCISGTVNASQKAWIDAALAELQSKPANELWPIMLVPPKQSFVEKPDMNVYCLKPLYIHEPDRQYQLTLSCPKEGCKGYLKFKEFSSPRSVDGVETNAFLCACRYRCSQRCSTENVSSTDEIAMVKAGVPLGVLKSSPLVVLKKTVLTKTLFELAMSACVSGSWTASGVARHVANARTRTYVEDSIQWNDHWNYFLKSVRRGRVDFSSPDSSTLVPVEFPHLGQHCDAGYNGTLGPTESSLTKICNSAVEQSREFYDRSQRAITGCIISWDHHHGVTAKAQIEDQNGNKFEPLGGVFAILNQKSQVMSHRFTFSTSAAEVRTMFLELIHRYEVLGIRIPFAAFIDRCHEVISFLNVFYWDPFL